MDEVPWISPYFPDTFIRLPPNSRQYSIITGCMASPRLDGWYAELEALKNGVGDLAEYIDL